jgi:endoglucanase
MKNRILYIMFAILIFLVSINAFSYDQGQTSSLPFLGVEGNRFVDEDGNTVILRGVSFPDPDRLAEANQWNKRYFQAAKDWNCNVVRIPIHPQLWRKRGEKEYLKLLDDGIEWAGELGMYVIIDWHTIGNPATEVFFLPLYNTSRAETFSFWRTIAERYAGNPVVAFYELFNEPTDYNGRLGRLSWQQYKKFIEEIIFIIYAHDRTVIPLVAGFEWGYDLRYVKDDPIDFPGVAYVTHPYPQKREPPWEEKWEADFGSVADTYPVFATEFGFMSEDGLGAHVPVIGDETYGEAIIGYFNKKGISWTAWVFDPLWSPQLIQDWYFTPTRQGRFFKDKLKELNK